MENKLNRYNLIYKISHKKKKKTQDFQKFKTIRSFGKEICNNDLSLNDALKLQIRLKYGIDILKESEKPKESVKNEKKALTLKNAFIILIRRQKVLNAFETGIFSKQGKRLTSILDCVATVSNHSNLKILSP